MGLFNIFNNKSDRSKSRFESDNVIPQFVVPEGIDVLGNRSFPNCEIEEIILPSSLKEIEYSDEEVFAGRKRLNYVDFSKVTKLKEIPECCFENCVSLESITIPEGVVTIGEGAFDGCLKLKRIFLPNSLKEISALNLSLNSSFKVDVYLFSNNLDDSCIEEIADNINHLFVAPQLVGHYQSIINELEIELQVRAIPAEYSIYGDNHKKDIVTTSETEIQQFQYYVNINNQQAGPFNLQQLAQMVQSGQVTAQSYVWKQGMPQWEIAGNVAELQSLFAPAMPPIPSMPGGGNTPPSIP